ncbi:MAG: Ig-like domain-containing protein [Renibacterium salmoninarum]|nr:Ig-like domain-containing protein [Renibacterium salmoninarum]
MTLASISKSLKGRSRLITASSLTVAGAVVVAGAVIYPGFTTADVNLNDGGIWVTNRSKNLVGHLNYQSKTLDGGFTATSQGFDVLQQASNVFMDNDSGSVLAGVDVPEMALQPETKLGGSKQVALGTGVLALVDKSKKRVWATNAATAGSFDDKNSKPLLDNLANPAAVVGFDDTVYALDGKGGKLTTATLDANGAVQEQRTSTIEGLDTDANLQITVVGGKPVVFDASAAKLYLPGNKTVSVEQARGALLQQRGADAPFVAIGTAKGLIEQPLDGSAARTFELPATGTPAAPVQQSGCVHMAWGGANKYLRYCEGSDNQLQDVPKTVPGAQFAFRQNRDIVVLNDVTAGTVWLVNKSMVIVDNWQDLETQTKNSLDAQKDSADPNFVNTLPDRSKPNRPPNAVADEFGVRAGKTTLLPVLYNDSDPDGDLLTVEPPKEQPAIGQLQTVYGGTGLQLTVPANTGIGSGQFGYTAVDGRGGTAVAPVSVRVVPDAENSPPELKRATTLVLEQGQSMTQNILSDWLDPDGDDIFLTAATSDDGSAQLKTTPDGVLTYSDLGQGAGIKTITVTVSDSRAQTQKQLTVNVKPAGSVPPIANADFVRTTVGQEITIAPLKNDIDPSGQGLRLSSIERTNTAEISNPADNGTFTFKSNTAGQIYLVYQVSNGPQSSTGLIRVDVAEAQDQSPPIAVKDLALLPSGGSTLVDVLGNDTDPGGGVLVVKSVTAPKGAAISATVLDHNVVKIVDLRGLTGTAELSYVVSNAYGSSTGQISVLPIPKPAKLAPPVTKPDEATVRVGDVVNIPVLANDFDPNGQPLKSPQIVQAPDAASGKLFVDQDQLRFVAGEAPGTVNAVYKVYNGLDSGSPQFDSSTVTIRILPADGGRNQAPVPKALTGRVIAGSTAKIQVPLDGIDPDGDSVQLVGVEQAPKLGTALLGSNYLQYSAAASSAGTDVFSYRVRDRLGAEAVATVRVGVAPAEVQNHPPVAADDVISMRPGRNVSLDVLLNDSDPDGNALRVDPDRFEGPQEMNPRMSEQGRVILTSPKDPGIYTMNYTITDGAATSNANIKMTVSPEAPLKAPIARDDHVTEQETLGKTAVDVPVLKNDEDPDGTVEELKLEVDPGNPTATVTGTRTIKVDLAQDAQVIPYTVTDVDNNKATALIWVPGLGKQYPALADSTPLEVVAGNSVSLDLNRYVKVRQGRSPRITQLDRVALIGAPSGGAASESGTSIEYKSDAAFYGLGSITFEVTDGNGPNDPEGLKSTLTVMVDVKPNPNNNRPPMFNGSTVEVAKGEPVELGLGNLAKDPDPDDNAKLAFDFDGDRPKNFDVSLSGQTLKVSVKGDVAPGSTEALPMKVSDGSNPAVKATLTLVATSTNKPLAVANDDIVPDALAGRSQDLSVLANDVNPFPETALKIIGVAVESGGGAVQASTDGSKVTVGTDENFKGNAVIRYTVADATNDSARQVTGRVRMNVKGKPEAPATPRVNEVKDHAVLLNWAPSADNGSPITSYTVRNSGGAAEQQCAANTCLITGLSNGTSYTFTVVANNAVGASPASPASAPAIPNRAPDTPNPPAAVFGDKQITVNWSTPTGDFTPVSKFDLEISPAPSGQNGQKSGIVGNSVVWSGLSNGTAYTFRIRAINSAPEPSQWSAYSAPETPAGVPAAPGAPSAQPGQRVAGNTTFSVSWNKADGNGDNNLSYTLNVLQKGAVVRTLPPQTPTNAVVELPYSADTYTFTVTATNKAGNSPASAPSAPQRSVSKPAQMAAPSIKAANTGGSGGQVQVFFTPLDASQLNGSSPNEISYYANVLNGGSVVKRGVPLAKSGDTVPAANGSEASVSVYASSRAYPDAGDASAPSNRLQPYGQPGTPAVSGNDGPEGSTNVTFNWSPPGNADVDRLEISIDGGGWENVGRGSGSRTVGDGNNQTHTINVRSINSVGTAGPVASQSARTGAPKPTGAVIQVKAGTVNTCLEERSGNGVSNNYSDPPPVCRSKWLPENTPVTVGCFITTGSARVWYRIDSPAEYAGRFRWVRADTTTKPNPAGLPAC